MKRLILVLEVESITSEGTVFTEWPLHCTLVHWFDYSGDVSNLIVQLQQLYDAEPAVELIGAEEAMFGARNDVPVNTLVLSEPLKKLHNQTAQLLARLGAQFTAERFMRQGYRPHVTHHDGRKLAQGQTRLSHAVYLVESVNEKPKQRMVVARLKLGGSNAQDSA